MRSTARSPSAGDIWWWERRTNYVHAMSEMMLMVVIHDIQGASRGRQYSAWRPKLPTNARKTITMVTHKAPLAHLLQ